MTEDWKAIWDRNGNTKSLDRYDISGFENFRSFDTISATDQLCQLLDIQADDAVLELGCAAGLLAQHLKHRCRYVGTDYSENIVKKTIEINGVSALCCEANDLVFKDKTFDHVFAFSVFQYFPDYDYAHQVVSEMIRVARKSVCVSDLPVASHESAHLLYREDFFAGWEITSAFYPREHRRFTATLRLANRGA